MIKCMGIEELPWDTEFLGFPVARIHADVSSTDVPKLLQHARDKGTQLVYWSPPCETLSPDVRRFYKSNHVVDQVILKKPVAKNPMAVSLPEAYYLGLTPAASADSSLYELAYLAGWCSRFRLDRRFAPDVFHRMYQIWIDRSCRGEIADAVISIKHRDQSIAGMVTLANKGRTCSIGLIAVSPGHQRKGLGAALMQAAEAFAQARQCSDLAVVTQVPNTAAICLYETAGFIQSESTACFHFWLDGERSD